MAYWAAGNRISADRHAKHIQAGQELISFTTQDSHVVDVTFPVAFDAAPIMAANLASGAGATARWGIRAINISATGFQIFVYSGASGATSTWTDIEVQWIAVAA